MWRKRELRCFRDVEETETRAVSVGVHDHTPTAIDHKESFCTTGVSFFEKSSVFFKSLVGCKGSIYGNSCCASPNDADFKQNPGETHPGGLGDDLCKVVLRPGTQGADGLDDDLCN